jgi:hypothetical protein
MARKKSKYSSRRRSGYNEKELMAQLRKNVGLLLVAVAVIVVTLGFFGPKLGSIFLLFSKYRNDSGPGDIIPPPVPIFSQAPKATNKEEITLNGITEPGATVKLFVNGPEKGKTTADNNGSFTFADIKISKGNNIIFAKATDENGNTSERSKILNIAFDDEEPEIQIEEPKNGSTVRNLNKRVFVSGNVNEQAEVTINGRRAVFNPDNTFETWLGVNEGELEIVVQATDEAGNTTTEKIYVTYKEES